MNSWLTPNGEDNVQKRTKSEQTIIRRLDLAELILDIKKNQNSTTPDNFLYLGNYEETRKNENKPEYKFFRSLNTEIFQSKLQTLLKNTLRTYEDILEGQKCYNETVFYRIEKSDKTGIIQNIFIPNDPILDQLSYFDTQVKYDKEYTYRVYAYQFVVGNKYWYSNVDVDSFDTHTFFQVNNEPNLSFVEVLIQTFSGKIIDVPPLFPEVQFISYKDVDNEISLYFNNNIRRERRTSNKYFKFRQKRI